MPCKGKTASLWSRRDYLHASEIVELPRSEGPRGQAAVILGQESRRRDPSNHRHREIAAKRVLGTGLHSVEDSDDKPSLGSVGACCKGRS